MSRDTKSPPKSSDCGGLTVYVKRDGPGRVGLGLATSVSRSPLALGQLGAGLLAGAGVDGVVAEEDLRSGGESLTGAPGA